MKYEIIPSMLSVEKDVQKYTDLLKHQVDSIHIDVMDGIFVEGKSFPVDEVVKINTDLRMIVHLMTVDPQHLVPDYALAGADTIIFHIEATKDPASVIRLIKDEDCRAGISLKPGTPLERIKPFIKDVDIVLVMAVEPGRGGQEIISEMILRIKELRDIAPDLDIMVDGGINIKTIHAVKQAGANKFVVGTGIFIAHDPVKAIELLREEIAN
ncbi:MAG: ribulose-phosphate 3-epimerase [Nanoarchaeota archaeon]|nr:ribulose-phosphate 3-epimerase [Nanoarchaeota archaeon]